MRAQATSQTASSGMHSCPLQQMNPAQHPSKTQVSGLMQGGSVGTGRGRDGPLNPRRAALASCKPAAAMAMPPTPSSPFSTPRRLVPDARFRAIVSNFRSSIASLSTAPERKRRLEAGAISFYAARMLCQSAVSPMLTADCETRIQACLLPLDRRRWFAGDVVHHAVDTADLVDDTVAHAGQHIVGDT